ncbi:hypothetical protein RhiLY_05889 [Ceratobasidium sp. AG-Ba]|nr:hypothetical protein RhiLY_05889 [Ceratobasidium sp. AG-Ba]
MFNLESRSCADYSLSILSTKRSEEGFASTAKLFNARVPSEVTVGHSSTNLTESLARAIEPTIKDEDEIIVSDADHEGVSSYKTSFSRLLIYPFAGQPMSALGSVLQNVKASNFIIGFQRPLRGLRTLTLSPSEWTI